jgi:hypothetical protein
MLMSGVNRGPSGPSKEFCCVTTLEFNDLHRWTYINIKYEGSQITLECIVCKYSYIDRLRAVSISWLHLYACLFDTNKLSCRGFEVVLLVYFKNGRIAVHGAHGFVCI